MASDMERNGTGRGSQEQGEIFTISAPPPASDIRQSSRDSRGHPKKSPPIVHPFGASNVLYSALTIFVVVVDYAADVGAAVSLKSDDIGNDSSDWWFGLTVTFIVGPSIIVNVFSIVWFWQDHLHARTKRNRRDVVLPVKEKLSCFEATILTVSHVLCLGTIVRQFNIVRIGRRERRQRSGDHSTDSIHGPYCLNHNIYRETPSRLDFYSLRRYRERDAAYLGLIHAFLQDGPQLVLQIYILSVRASAKRQEQNNTIVFQSLSVLTSLMALSWSMIAYERANRAANPEKPKVSTLGYTLQYLWRFCVLAARVLTLAVFASIYPEAMFLLGALHWLIMAAWTFAMETNFCGSVDGERRPLSEIVYVLVVGWIFIFDVLHVKEGPTRVKFLLYYTLMLMEMAALLSLWFVDASEDHLNEMLTHHEEDFQVAILSLTPSLFAVGILSMLAYYRWGHPTGRMPKKDRKGEIL